MATHYLERMGIAEAKQWVVMASSFHVAAPVPSIVLFVLPDRYKAGHAG